MRERSNKPVSDTQTRQNDNILADVKSYFTSFYKSTISGKPQDRHTIPGVTEAESRFHYNATENAILKALIHHEPLPPGAETWHFLQQRKEWRVLDIGSGTGHWIDFYKDVFFAAHVSAVEIVEDMASYLNEKYKSDPAVEVLSADVSDENFSAGTYDLVNAIGVMFHIVDDEKWRQAMHNLTKATLPGGLLVIGGDFGKQTKNVQFHKDDNFESWQEHDAIEKQEQIVNKRLRSLDDWSALANDCGLNVIEVIRAESDSAFSTPENDILLLQKPE
jgi:SAM-dependent methyltransferase